jgi:hypothetical protein
MLPRFLSLAVLILAIQPALDACTTFSVRAGNRVLNQLHSHRNAGSHDEAFGRTAHRRRACVNFFESMDAPSGAFEGLPIAHQEGSVEPFDGTST